MDDKTKVRMSDERVEELAYKPWLVLTSRTNIDVVLALASDLRDARTTIRAQAKRIALLTEAVRGLHSACDRLMGDSDLPYDDSQEMQAMKFAMEAVGDCAPTPPAQVVEQQGAAHDRTKG